MARIRAALMTMAGATAATFLLFANSGDGHAQGRSSDAKSGEMTLAAAGGQISTGIATASKNAGSPAACKAGQTFFTEARMGAVKDQQGNEWFVPANVHQGDPGVDLFNDCTGPGAMRDYEQRLKTVVIDPDGVEITAWIHADNYAELYVNGVFVCRDPIGFTPFNSTACRFKAKYPITYALRGVDWEQHLGVGMEYARYNVGDGGVFARFSDGTKTDGAWKAEVFYISPLDNTSCIRIGAQGERDTSACPVKPACATPEKAATCQAVHFKEPEGWMRPGFNDSAWPAAKTYTLEEYGDKPARSQFATEFGAAEPIWTRNLKTDNLVLLRKTVTRP